MTVMASETEIPLLRGDIALLGLSTTLAVSWRVIESDKTEQRAHTMSE